MDAVLLRQPGFKKSFHVLTHPCFHGAALMPNDIEINRNNFGLFIKPETILNMRRREGGLGVSVRTLKAQNECHFIS